MRRRNATVAVACLAVAVGMLVLAGASPLLYRMFLAATGGGTAPASAAPSDASARTVTVRFETEAPADAPWRLGASRAAATIHPGEETRFSFWVENTGEQPLTGHAVLTVRPAAAGRYLRAIRPPDAADRTIAPHRQVMVPVAFYVDPALEHDAALAALPAITLSVSFSGSAAAARPAG